MLFNSSFNERWQESRRLQGTLVADAEQTVGTGE